ncbi:hypothetical protein UY3_07771 [Chelonia mydas]|uniref:Uncharacterized protein n=1 Tax=Chelonia mydas TaxID=8469 RepID=M7BSJ3_CHEMY|nr:hypothetical protein UY3_07771 [Chelonia mydas]
MSRCQRDVPIAFASLLRLSGGPVVLLLLGGSRGTALGGEGMAQGTTAALDGGGLGCRCCSRTAVPGQRPGPLLLQRCLGLPKQQLALGLPQLLGQPWGQLHWPLQKSWKSQKVTES